MSEWSVVRLLLPTCFKQAKHGNMFSAVNNISLLKNCQCCHNRWRFGYFNAFFQLNRGSAQIMTKLDKLRYG